MYQVSTHEHGSKRITRDCPAQGLLEWPQHIWTTITPRPVGLAKAKALAEAAPHHAVVNVWKTAEKVYDNGKPPAIPQGWHAPEAAPWPPLPSPSDAQAAWDRKRNDGRYYRDPVDAARMGTARSWTRVCSVLIRPSRRAGPGREFQGRDARLRPHRGADRPL